MQLTPKEIASEWGISAKTLRKFLRAASDANLPGIPERPGKGGRWAIERKSLRSLRKGFDAYIAQLEANRGKGDDAPESPEMPPMLEGHELLDF